MHRDAFTLIEMLLATTLTALLMGGVLMLLGGANRDAQTLRRQAEPQLGGLFALLTQDLANATELSQSADATLVELSGNIGIDGRSLRQDGRLVRVSYQVGSGGVLQRRQVYLDAPDRPQPWSELAAINVEGLGIVSTAADPTRVRIVIATAGGTIAREVRIR
jgi:type II secretory pathway component PulJ